MTQLINAYATLHEVPTLDFPHRLIGRRDHRDPELATHLQGFIGYVLGTGDGRMTYSRYHTMRHLQRVRQQLSLEVEGAHFPAFAEWAQAANALCFFSDGSVRDPLGRVLVSPDPSLLDEAAQVPYPPDALARRTRQQASLAAQGMHAPASLPPVVGLGEACLREPGEVAARMLALFAVALRAEMLATGEAPLSLAALGERLPTAVMALSPQERGFFEDDAADAQAIANFGWRYEGAALLQWALGLSGSLAAATAICDVPAVARIALAHGEADGAVPALRPMTELLDALDAHYRMHWVVRQARRDDVEASAGLNPGVVYERHHALNWLFRFEEADWDDVDTPT